MTHIVIEEIQKKNIEMEEEMSIVKWKNRQCLGLVHREWWVSLNLRNLQKTSTNFAKFNFIFSSVTYLEREKKLNPLINVDNLEKNLNLKNISIENCSWKKPIFIDEEKLRTQNLYRTNCEVMTDWPLRFVRMVGYPVRRTICEVTTCHWTVKRLRFKMLKKKSCAYLAIFWLIFWLINCLVRKFNHSLLSEKLEKQLNKTMR